MKTLEEFVKEINDSKELQDEIRGLKDAEGLEEFLKRHACDAKVEEFLKYARPFIIGRVAPYTAGGLPIHLTMTKKRNHK